MQAIENITFKDDDTLTLIDYLINIYIAKYPINGYISKDHNLHLVNIEKHLNKNQLSIIKYPYQIDKPINIILISPKGQKIFLSIMTDPATGIIDKEIIDFLNRIYSNNLNDNTTAIELYDYILNYNIPIISIDSLTSYILECQKKLDLRDIITEYVAKSLLESDMSIVSNGIYRSKKFTQEMNTCYHTQKKLVLSKR